MSNTYQSKYDLIIEACKVDPNSDLVQNYIQKIDDWSSLLEISYMHGILPLVYKTLKQHPSFPSAAQQIFKIHNLQIAQLNMKMTTELTRVVRLLDENGIKYIALKGPVLSQLIHDDTIQRQYSDLDILVKKEDIYKTGQLLYDNGYTSEYELKFLKNKTLAYVGKDFTFQHKESNILIEMHWKLFLSKHIIDLDKNLFTTPLLPVNINHYSVLTLSYEYLLVYLCLHGSKHYWERIEWIVDIDRLIRSNTSINWDEIQILCQTMRIEAMVYLGFAVSSKLLNTPIPDQINDAIKKFKNVYTAQNDVISLIYAHDIANDNHSHTQENLLKEAPLKDTAFISFKHYFLTYFQINQVDVFTINLPAYLSFLYYPIKFFRLFLKHTK
jgi:hypothetical protein